MKNEIDARGLPCPEPVVLAKKGIEKFEEFVIIVDDQEARENVTRFAESTGCRIAFEKRGRDLRLTITRPSGPIQDKPAACSAGTTPSGPTVVVIAATVMGRGNDELGALLMKSFLHTLTEASRKPDIMIFLNTGVMLTIEGSEVLDDLKTLSRAGTKILACGTCLGFFEVKDKLAAGTVSNMYDITDAMLTAGRIIQI